MAKENIIQSKSFNFSLKIIELYKLLKLQNEFILSKQLVRAGTSIGANVEEAIAGSSKRDFISKMTIAAKEARETRYWIRLLKESKLCNFDSENFIKDIDEIILILTSIIKTSQENMINFNSRIII